MKRTVAAFTILLGLTALVIGMYIGQFKAVTEMLHNYTALLP